MKVKFNRNVKHNGRYYEMGKVYEFDEELTPNLKELLELTHEDVFTQKNTTEEAHVETVKVAEEAPEGAPAEPQPPVAPKTPRPGVAPAPNVEG